jgi:hypothetical protein
MLYSETIAVCSQIHTKHINTLCGQNVQLVITGPAKGRNFQIHLLFSTAIYILIQSHTAESYSSEQFGFSL